MIRGHGYSDAVNFVEAGSLACVRKSGFILTGRPLMEKYPFSLDGAPAMRESFPGFRPGFLRYYISKSAAQADRDGDPP
jgi:hypothetical protein